ncbi:MAG: pilus assembly protein PilB [Cyanobacteria bacterium P01_F01_bin.4]
MSETPQDRQADAPSGGPKADLKQMFVLIEGILPFEACLYYQVLPLSIEGSCLNLGMVNPGDHAAADYVRRLVSYINCSIVPRQIPSDWHREILSKFLSHAAKSRQQQPLAADDSAPSPKPKTSNSFQESPTLVVSAPTELIEERSVATTSSAPPPDSIPVPVSAPVSDPVKVKSVPAVDLEEPALALPTPPASPALPASPAPRARAASSTGGKAPLDLDLRSQFQQQPLDILRQLSPKAMTQELLSRVVTEGIGRLYLERQSDHGRILWSKDGVLQSVLENISTMLFQGAINELKLLTRLSLIPVRKTKQVEIERTYQGQRILLRLRIIPGKHGEEATLQVLRGAALKFYQQQQVEKLSRDALGMAHTLHQRLNEIRDQACRNLDLEAAPIQALPAIVDLLHQMEQQIQEMIVIQEHSPPEFQNPFGDD